MPQAFQPDSLFVNQLHPSPNVEPRRDGAVPDILLLHYTGFLNVDLAIDWLARPESKVSCHYVIDELGVVTQMVPEALRAWHAGDSSWHGMRDINSCSIGIEIQNPGHDRGYPDFTERQMEGLIALCRDIIARHGIAAERVLAHSDIAPRRKMDPGERFDWRRMAAAGIGHWVEPEPVAADGTDDAENDRVGQMQALLEAYGYLCPQTGVADADTRIVVTAFQRHFRPERVDGLVDASSLRTLERLLDALPASKVA